MLTYSVNFGGCREEVRREEGGDNGDILQFRGGGVGDDYKVFFNEKARQTLALLTPGTHLVHPDPNAVQHGPEESGLG